MQGGVSVSTVNIVIFVAEDLLIVLVCEKEMVWAEVLVIRKSAGNTTEKKECS